jgi:hypothetical protein
MLYLSLFITKPLKAFKPKQRSYMSLKESLKPSIVFYDLFNWQLSITGSITGLNLPLFRSARYVGDSRQ